ncbi:hypothetical protein MAR_017552 [Mya arenaria]|uniref:Uncharacterized protein n=3 Tax=Mya arenaria TaxID=6604 RepID=A0ABY7EGR8_MYAAR|nr:hypothetical protein MAR_017552 [Mya arenaria]
MMKIIEYLRLLGLRPLELLKSFNKTSSFEMPREGFADQIKKIGVKLQPFEIDALANSISGKGFNKNVINYRKLSLAVREVVEAERERKNREREEWLQIKTYHESILKKGSLEDYISHTGSAKLAEPLDQLKVNSFQTIGLSGSRHSTVASRAPSVHTSRVAMSTVSLAQSTTTLRSAKKKVRKRRKKRVL